MCEQPFVSRRLLRDCVHTLHSRDTWLKQARVVRLGEVPYKVSAAGRRVATRPGGRTGAAWARGCLHRGLCERRAFPGTQEGRAGKQPSDPGVCLRPWGQICVPCVSREAAALPAVDTPTPALCGLCVALASRMRFYRQESRS